MKFSRSLKWLSFSASSGTILSISLLTCSNCSSNGNIAFLGAAGIDYFAEVDRFPLPDQKIRASSSGLYIGGNSCNSIAQFKKLSSHQEAFLISKIGDDYFGQRIVDELESVGVKSDFIVKHPNSISPFTYVIVDCLSQTRTCIHSPMTSELSLSEIDAFIAKFSELDIAQLHFDSRHTYTALSLARYASKLGVRISIDCEKDRPPYFLPLMFLADTVFTSKSFLEVSRNLLDENIIEIGVHLENQLENYNDYAKNAINLFQHLQRQRLVNMESRNKQYPLLLVSTLGEEGAIGVWEAEPIVGDSDGGQIFDHCDSDCFRFRFHTAQSDLEVVMLDYL